MTPDQAQKFVRYALTRMTETEHVAALLALRHCERDAAREIDSAEERMHGRLTPLERERLVRVASRYDEVAEVEDQHERYALESFDDSRPMFGVVKPLRRAPTSSSTSAQPGAGKPCSDEGPHPGEVS